MSARIIQDNEFFQSIAQRGITQDNLITIFLKFFKSHPFP